MLPGANKFLRIRKLYKTLEEQAMFQLKTKNAAVVDIERSIELHINMKWAAHLKYRQHLERGDEIDVCSSHEQQQLLNHALVALKQKAETRRQSAREAKERYFSLRQKVKKLDYFIERAARLEMLNQMRKQRIAAGDRFLSVMAIQKRRVIGINKSKFIND
jgi:hypothetical protein